MDFSLITNEPLNYCVYVHINNVNGKIYIGITNDTKRRWGASGLYYKGCPKLYRAIKKYGWDNFQHIILVDNLSREIAGIIEEALIRKYDTINNGYNITTGGWHGAYDRNIPIYQYDFDGNFIKKWDRTIDAINEYGFGIQDVLSGRFRSAHGYQWRYQYYQQIQPYSIRHDFNKHIYKDKQISAYDMNGNIFKTFNGYDDLDDIFDKRVIRILCDHEREYVYENLIWGYSNEISGEHVERVIRNYYSEYRDGVKNKHPFKVKQFTLNGDYITTYESPRDVEKQFGFTAVVIENVCRGIINIGFGFLWRFSCDETPVIVIKTLTRSGEPVVQKDLNGNIIATFPSAMAAARKYSNAKRANSSDVLDVCNGKRKTAYGYIWEFENQEVR